MSEDVALWKRVSSDQQDIRNQDDTLTADVARNGYDVRRVFSLPDTSAFKGEQEKALAEVLADVKAGRYTRVIAVTSSRFLRSDECIGVDYLLALKKAGGRLAATDNPLFGDLTNQGGWHVTVAALGGDYLYSKNISGNVNRGNAMIDQNGAFRGAVPAGYSVQGEYKARFLVKDTGQPERPREYKGETKKGKPRGPRRRFLATQIAKAFELAATEPGSTPAVGRMLGLSPHAVAKILRNPVYGSGRYELTTHQDCPDGATCKKGELPCKARIVVHRCEPLVTPDIQRAAIAGIDARWRGDNVTPRALRRAMIEADPSKNDFANVLWCGMCEVQRPTMQRYYGGGRPHTDGTKSPKERRYRCVKQMGGCGRSVNADTCDAVVSRLMSDNTRRWQRLVPVPGNDNSAEEQRVRDELDSLGARRLPRAEMQAETNRLYDELERLEALPKIPTRWVMDFGEQTIGQRWAELDMTRRREWLLADFRVRVKGSGNRDGTVIAEFGDMGVPVIDVTGQDIGDGLRASVSHGGVNFWKGEE